MAKKTKTTGATPAAPTPLDDLPPRRRAILGAAFDVLMEQGYAGAAVDAVLRLYPLAG